MPMINVVLLKLESIRRWTACMHVDVNGIKGFKPAIFAQDTAPERLEV